MRVLISHHRLSYRIPINLEQCADIDVTFGRPSINLSLTFLASILPILSFLLSHVIATVDYCSLSISPV